MELLEVYVGQFGLSATKFFWNFFMKALEDKKLSVDDLELDLEELINSARELFVKNKKNNINTKNTTTLSLKRRLWCVPILATV